MEKFIAARPLPPDDVKLSPEEWDLAMKEASKMIIADLDANGDGFIQWSELVANFNKRVFECSDEASAKAKVDAKMPVENVPIFIDKMKDAIKRNLA